MGSDYRLRLAEGKQKELIETAKEKTGLTWNRLADILKLNSHYLSHEIRQEKRTLLKTCFENLVRLAGEDYSQFIIGEFDSNWGQQKGGRNSSISGKRKCNEFIAPKLDENLAELIGAYLGDGTLTKYFLRISGDQKLGLPYLNHLKDLFSTVFGLNAVIRAPPGRAAFVEVRSVKFCDYLNKKFGLQFGNKIINRQKIPDVILADEKLSLACFRGLMDTDGTVSKRGNQTCLAFTAHNPLLLEQVWRIGESAGIFTYKSQVQIGTNSWQNIVKYFNLVGSSNLKHIVTFCERVKTKKTPYKTEVLRYYPQYNNFTLPYFGPVV